MALALDDITILEKAKYAPHRGFASWDNKADPHPHGTDQCLCAFGENPFCGDELEMRLIITPDDQTGYRVRKAAFDGYGCTLCLAAAEAVSEYIEGRSVAQASALTFEDVCTLLGGLSVGRTRKGCVDLAARVVANALAQVVE